jgi:hypothetical protein
MADEPMIKWMESKIERGRERQRKAWERVAREINEERADLGRSDPDRLLFTTLGGYPVRHSLFYKRTFRPAVKAALPARLHALRWHDLRHTCARSASKRRPPSQHSRSPPSLARHPDARNKPILGTRLDNLHGVKHLHRAHFRAASQAPNCRTRD